MIRGESIKIADSMLWCNACLYIKQHLEDNRTDVGFTFTEWRAVVEAKNNNWMIMPGQEYRSYYEGTQVWTSGEPQYDEWEEVCEIPAMARICQRMDMYGPGEIENPYE